MKKTTMVWLTIFSILIVIISFAVYYFLRHPLFLYEKTILRKSESKEDVTMKMLLQTRENQ